MLKIYSKSLLVVFFAAASVMLHADTYNYVIIAGAANGDPATSFNATGTLSGPADPYNTSAVDLTGITGSANGYNFLGVVDPGMTDSQNPGNAFGFDFDNVLYTSNSASHVDSVGMLLYLSSPVGTSLAHVYSSGSSGYMVDVIDPNEPGASTPFTIAGTLPVSRFSITPAAPTPAVPEPASFVLLGSGLATMAGLIRRKVSRAR